MKERVVKFEPGKSYVYATSARNHTSVVCTQRTRCYATFKFEDGTEFRKKIHLSRTQESLDNISYCSEFVSLSRRSVYADWEW